MVQYLASILSKEGDDVLSPAFNFIHVYIAVARKMLVAVWHILTDARADCHADPQQVAVSLFALAYRMRICNLPEGQSALQFTRNQLDRLGIGQDVKEIPWGSRCFKLPTSKLAG